MELQLRSFRKAHRLTQEELANKIGQTPRVVSAWERGETSITLSDAAVIADVFGCSLDELAGRDFRPEGSYSDPRQAELNRVWGQIGEQRRDRLLETAHDFEALERGASQRLSNEAAS